MQEQRAAYLAVQLFNAPAASRGALTMAIWYTMDAAGTTSVAPGVVSDTATMTLVNAAANATLSPSMFTNLAIYSPTNSTNQRFMAQVPYVSSQTASPTPEPGSVVLLATGGILIFGLRRRLARA